jgi:hypothetical protein
MVQYLYLYPLPVGLATYFHADYVASFYPQATVKAMPVSGFFLNVTNVAGDYVYGTQMSVRLLLR